MELPAVRPPRLSWHRRFLTQILPRPSTTTRHSLPVMPTTYDVEPFKDGSRATSIASSASQKSPTCETRSSLLERLHLHSAAAIAKPPSRKYVLPHTITERQGGRDLWVTAPVLGDELEKQGFRWRKKWKPRFVELNGRVLSYYEVSHATTGRARAPRQSVHITANAHIVDVDSCTFSLLPNPGEKPWVFRARDAATKHKWCRALHDCIDILIWLQHYELGDVLGVGGNGVVCKLTDTRSGKQYAVKIVDAAKFKNRQAIVSEVEILRNITNDIKHPNLVTIHKVYEEHNKIYLILDLCEGGELYDAIVHRGCYGERDAAAIMAQLMGAVDALHQHNILHLDLKPENILLSSKNPSDAKIVLTDFGLARMIHGKANPLGDRGGDQTMAGTIGYIAPEVIAAHQYSEAADVFSAGVILFILLVGYPPFYGDSEVEILLKIARGDFQFHAADWAHISLPAKELVARMLEVRAQDRITVREVLAHPWLQTHTPKGSATKTNTVALKETVERMQQFNFLRKSESMASCMATMLSDASEEDYQALVNKEAIDALIRQLTPAGSNRLVVDKAFMLCRHLGLSPFVNVHDFVGFLDRNQDGFIDAQDFCDGVKAMREGHASFAKIIFSALRDMLGQCKHADTTEDASLTRNDFVVAFEKLECPEPLSRDFFGYIDKHPDMTIDGEGDRIDEAAFIHLFKTFSFFAALFVLKAKNNIVRIAKSGSTESLALITEETRDSLALE
jgi:serine/threonine protein kinase